MKYTPSTNRARRGLANLLVLVQKNLKLLVRARASALVVILGPLLVIFLAGLAFDNTNLYSVRVGTFSESYNDLSNSFIDQLAEKQFKITRYPAEEACVGSIRRGESHTCIIFAPDFTIGKNGSNEIKFSVDYSQINLVWTILNVMTESISSRSLELSRNLTAVLLHALDVTQGALTERRQNLIGLTTQNDEIGQRVANIQAELLELELSLDPGELGIGDLTSSKTIVKHWVDNSLALGHDALSAANGFINALDSLVSGPDISASLQSTMEEISAVTSRLETTESLVQQEYTELSSQIDSIAGKLTQTKAQIDNAASVHVFTLDELNIINELLDRALLNVLTVQKSVNEIERVIKSVEITDADAIVQPVKTTITPVVSEQSYLNYLFPSLIALVILFTALLLAPTLILFERKSPAFFRNFMTPTSDIVFLGSTFVTTAFLLILQLTIILAIASIFFTQILSAFLYTAIVLVLFISLCTFLGMTIGYVFNTEETAMFASISVGSLFLFISDIIIPLESMPATIMSVAQFNPAVIASDLLRRTMLFNATFSEIGSSLFALFLFTLASLGLLLAVYYGSKKKSFSKYLAKAAPRKEPVK